MSKGLEALKRIKSRYNDRVCIDILEDFDLVEKELEDLDTIKEIFSQYGLEYKLTLAREALLLLKQYQGSYGVRGQALITKKLKALEAIKRNPILIIRLLTNNATYKYVVEVTNENERPTQEEWDLLKEELKK